MTISLIEVKKYYSDLKHQTLAIEYLGDLLLNSPAKERLGLQTNTDWIKISDLWLEWLQNQITQRTLNKFEEIWKGESEDLDITDNDDLIKDTQRQVYYIQLDNNKKPYSVCNSVAHAMMLKYLKPDSLGSGKNADQEYVNKVLAGEFGRKGYRNPSIYWDVQAKGLQSYGINVKINTNHDRAALEAQVAKGIPTPVNIAYKSSGHVICLVGVTETHFQVFDPYGEMDYVSGTYIKFTNQQFDSGKYRVSKKGFYKRWQSVFTQLI